MLHIGEDNLQIASPAGCGGTGQESRQNQTESQARTPQETDTGMLFTHAVLLTTKPRMLRSSRAEHIMHTLLLSKALLPVVGLVE